MPTDLRALVDRRGFDARLMPERREKWQAWTAPRLVVWVRLDLGNGPEWVCVGYLR